MMNAELKGSCLFIHHSAFRIHHLFFVTVLDILRAVFLAIKNVRRGL